MWQCPVSIRIRLSAELSMFLWIGDCTQCRVLLQLAAYYYYNLLFWPSSSNYLFKSFFISVSAYRTLHLYGFQKVFSYQAAYWRWSTARGRCSNTQRGDTVVYVLFIRSFILLLPRSSCAIIISQHSCRLTNHYSPAGITFLHLLYLPYIKKGYMDSSPSDKNDHSLDTNQLQAYTHDRKCLEINLYQSICF